MNNKWKGVEAMLFLSITFTVLLIGVRFVYTGKLQFLLFIWNLFLAVIPLLVSRWLTKSKSFNSKSIVALCCWLLFLPNAPYIITDIVHFHERPDVSKWFDLLMVTSAAWNGVMLGIVSLLQVEDFLHKHLQSWKVNIIMMASIFACSFGIFLGRFLRFNSWDVITDPIILLKQITYQFIHPHQNTKTWAFTVLFAALFGLIYYTVKMLPISKVRAV